VGKAGSLPGFSSGVIIAIFYLSGTISAAGYLSDGLKNEGPVLNYEFLFVDSYLRAYDVLESGV
jgi:hypothetical protein